MTKREDRWERLSNRSGIREGERVERKDRRVRGRDFRSGERERGERGDMGAIKVEREERRVRGEREEGI